MLYVALRVSEQILQQNVNLVELNVTEGETSLTTEGLLEDLPVTVEGLAVRQKGQHISPADTEQKEWCFSTT